MHIYFGNPFIFYEKELMKTRELAEKKTRIRILTPDIA